MTAYATPPLAVAGQPLAAATWNSNVRDSMEAIAKPERCKVRRTTAQSIANATITAVSWETEDYDTANLWAIGNPTKVIVTSPGLYIVEACAVFVVNATGIRSLNIQIVKAGVASYHGLFGGPAVAGWPVSACVVSTEYLATGDDIQLHLYQTSGAALNVDVSNLFSNFLAVTKIGQ